MNNEKIQGWISTIANCSVLAGIIFVAIEIGQNNELMKSEARYNRAENRIAANYQIIDSPLLVAAAIKSRDGENLTAEEDLALRRMSVANYVSFQLTYQDYAAGLLEFEDLPIEGWKETTSNKIFQETWQGFALTNLRPDFISWFEQNVFEM